MKIKWTIVGFNHPEEGKSLVYKQNILQKTLIKTIEEGIEKGCNLFSIRGIDDNAKYYKGMNPVKEVLEWAGD